MLVKRIIPCLDVDKGKVMKGIKFQELTEVGDPIGLASLYNKQLADELVFLDIGASPQNRDTLYGIVKQVSKEIFIPLTVGGGIRTLRDIQNALSNGADKVSINTAGVLNPNFISDAAKRFGSQCIVCAIDAQRKGDSWQVLTYGGRKKTDIDAVKWAKKAKKLGAGEILLTSWDADGTKEGYDVELTRTIVECTNIPVIASGGAGSVEDILEVLTDGKADAALIASLFHYGTYTVQDVKDYLKDKGVNVR
jgi:cyclase